MSKSVPTKPLLIMLYGFPGSGKSHFARSLTEHLQCAHVQGDRVRFELFEEPRFDKQENAIITHLMNYMTEEFLSAGVSVIYDVNAMRLSQRLALRELARKKKAQPLLIWFQIDHDSAYARLLKRDRRKVEDKYSIDYTPESFKRLAAYMQNPTATEDYLVVSGKHTYLSQKSALFRKLMEQGVLLSASAQAGVIKPGLVNLVPNQAGGRVDMGRRNIRIH
jgi:predicted kinase